jgi:hypothetical protein
MPEGMTSTNMVNLKTSGLAPLKWVEVLNNNTFILHNLDDVNIFGGPVNGCFLKHFFV